MLPKNTSSSRQLLDASSINHAIEEVFLILRAAKQAQFALDEGLPLRGALAVFPIVVFAPGLNTKKSIRPYPMRVSLEPGSVLEKGVHAVSVAAKVKEHRVKGVFYIVVDDKEPSEIPEAKWSFKDEDGKSEKNEEIDELPESFWLPLTSRPQLRREIRKLIHSTEKAYSDLYHLSMPTMRAALQKYQSALFHQSASLDMSDILQECWLRHLQRIETYASPQRPNATWRQVLVVNTRRDGGRELRRNPHKISDQVAQLVGVIRNNPDLRTPEDVQRHVTITKEIAKRQKENPSLDKTKIQKEVEKLWKQNKLEPKVSIRVAENAFLAAPFENTTSLSSPISSGSEMSQDDFLADPTSTEDHHSQFELEEQLREVVEIVEILFPGDSRKFLTAMGLTELEYTAGEEDGLTPGEARKQFLRKFKVKQNNPTMENIRAHAFGVLFTPQGDLRPASELKEKISELKSKGMLA